MKSLSETKSFITKRRWHGLRAGEWDVWACHLVFSISWIGTIWIWESETDLLSILKSDALRAGSHTLRYWYWLDEIVTIGFIKCLVVNNYHHPTVGAQNYPRSVKGFELRAAIGRNRRARLSVLWLDGAHGALCRGGPFALSNSCAALRMINYCVSGLPRDIWKYL